MKFYVTGRSSNFEQVKEAFAHIKEEGHEVVFEWTSLPMVKPYSENGDKAAEFAEAAITGLIAADIYIIFVHKDGNGVFTEFGAALASQVATGKPKIFAIGEKNFDWGMFYAHPAIVWKNSLEEVFEDLGI